VRLTSCRVLYWTKNIDQSGGGQFTFSNGDPTGYGFHGDFMNGWTMTTQAKAIENCLYVDNGGTIAGCPDLLLSDDVNFARNCPEQPSVLNEAVHGIIASLPGCNTIRSGPENAPQDVCSLNNTSPMTIPATSGYSRPMATSTLMTFATSITSTTNSSHFTCSADFGSWRR
jgi:hypothetical protein